MLVYPVTLFKVVMRGGKTPQGAGAQQKNVNRRDDMQINRYRAILWLALVLGLVAALTFQGTVVPAHAQGTVKKAISGETVARELPATEGSTFADALREYSRNASGKTSPGFSIKFAPGPGSMEVTRDFRSSNNSVVEVYYNIPGESISAGGKLYLAIRNSQGETTVIRTVEFTSNGYPGSTYGYSVWDGSLRMFTAGSLTFVAYVLNGNEVTQVEAEVQSWNYPSTPFVKTISERRNSAGRSVVEIEGNFSTEPVQITYDCCSVVSAKAIVSATSTRITIDPSLDKNLQYGYARYYDVTVKQGGKCTTQTAWHDFTP